MKFFSSILKTFLKYLYNTLSIMVIIEIVIILLGGYLYSLIPGEKYDCQSSLHIKNRKNRNFTKIMEEILRRINKNITTYNDETKTDYLSFSDSIFFVITTTTSIGNFYLIKTRKN